MPSVRTVSTVWGRRTVSTMWGMGTVSTMWGMRTVSTMWGMRSVSTITMTPSSSSSSVSTTHVGNKQDKKIHTAGKVLWEQNESLWGYTEFYTVSPMGWNSFSP